MIVLEVCVVVVLVGLTAAAVLGRLGGGWTGPVSSHRHDQLPEGDLGRDDIAALRFDQGLRGYRMDQVDAVITRLTEELEFRDERIAALRVRAGEPDTGRQQTSCAPDGGARGDGPTGEDTGPESDEPRHTDE